MLRRLQAFLALGEWSVATAAAAQEPTDKPMSVAPRGNVARAPFSEMEQRGLSH
jgi:hypothetical protein